MLKGYGYNAIGFDLKKNSELKRPYFDIGIAFWLLDPDAKIYTPENIFKVFLKKEWKGSEKDILAAFRFAHKMLKAEGLLGILEEIEMPLVRVLREMEECGIQVDKKKLEELRGELEKEIASLGKKIMKLAGEKFNVNSPRQLGHILFEKLRIQDARGAGRLRRTAGGALSTNIEQLEAYRAAHPIVDAIIMYRGAYKLLRTYAVPILALLDKRSRLHTTFVQTGTATGRLSSETPNMQNVPVAEEDGIKWGKKLRSCFVAAPGFELVALDYSQLELRILASLAEDPVMIESFRKGKDIHAITASQVFHVPLHKVTKEMRRVAKTLNFGVVYGMGSSAFAQVSGLPLHEAKEFIEDYFRHFHRIKEWQEGMRRAARAAGYVQTLTGRKRKVSGILSPIPRIASYYGRIAINMPIQGLGADILKKAMILCREKLSQKGWWGKDARMLLSIHDELLFEVRSDIIKETTEIVTREMEAAAHLKVPLAVKASRGKHWGALVPME